MSDSSDKRPAWMGQASRWLLALGIAGSALAVGTVHTVTLCVVTVVLAAAAVLGWWGAEPMRARSSATLLLFTGIGLTEYTALQCAPIGWLAVIAPHNADVCTPSSAVGTREDLRLRGRRHRAAEPGGERREVGA
jgi:hypothetical protein